MKEKMKMKYTKKEVEKLLEGFNPNTAKTIANGKSKAIYRTKVDGVCLMEFKPSLRSITYKRKGNIVGTEKERMKACLELYLYLEKQGVPTQLLHDEIILIDRRYFMLIKAAKQIPIEWIARYYASGSITRLFPTLAKDGQKFDVPLLKFDLKQEAEIGGVDDPMLNESYIVGLNLLKREDLETCKKLLLKIANALDEKFKKADFTLVDLKMELGYDVEGDGKIILTDEISQDCMRVNDSKGNSITKDVFREWQTENDVLKAYQKFTKVVSFDENKGL